MADNTLEILDKSLVAALDIPDEPSAQPQVLDINAMFNKPEIASLMRQPLTVSQVVTMDPNTGAALPGPATYKIESIKSQKTVQLNALRVEVHDRSDATSAAETHLPELFAEIVNVLGRPFKAVGANHESLFKTSDETPATVVIARQVFRQDAAFVPAGMSITGGAARISLGRESDSDVAYSVAVEPRFNDPTSSYVWMQCNANKPTTELPSIAELASILDACSEVSLKLQESLFR